MIKKNEGHIVSIASFVAFIGSFKLTDYSASKFANRGFYEALRAEIEVSISLRALFKIELRLF